MQIDERVLQILGYMAIEKTGAGYCQYCLNNCVYGVEEHTFECPHRLAIEVLEELKREEQYDGR